MTTLLVSPFAPYRDGIAAYALQELRRLRESGEEVEVCSPLPSAARWHLALGGPAGMWQLVSRSGRHDRILMQFGPELAFGRCRSASERVAVWLALAALGRRRPLELRIHEVEYGPLDQNPIERAAARLALSGAERVTVHTSAERDALDRRTGLGSRIDLVEHGRDFRPAIRLDRSQARRRLGLADDGFRFVAIGFLQHHKGFDRAVDAIEGLPADTHLHIVGSARVDHPEITSYVASLRGRCARVANASLHERFVSDLEFDLWLQAADAVVLPYREIWSSGVLERARLFGVQVLASDLPQLAEQAPPGTRFFADVDQLAALMVELRTESPVGAGLATGSSTSTNGSGGPGTPAGPGRVDDPTGDRPGHDPGWTVDRLAPDRHAIERQVVARARTRALGAIAATDPGDPGPAVATGAGVAAGPGPGPVTAGSPRAVDALVSLGPLPRPQPTSARPGVAPIKRLVDRLTAWRVDPLARRLEELQRATTEAVARLDAAIVVETTRDEQEEPHVV